MRLISTLSAVLALAAQSSPAVELVPQGMVLIPASNYQPFYAGKAPLLAVSPFYLGVTQVTNAQFLDFVRAHPEWRRSKVSRSQADAGYLKHWAADLDLGPDSAQLRDAPVTHVSWHAAKAFCEAQGGHLPTQDEWESAARADATRADASHDPAFLARLLEWYSTPSPRILPPVHMAPADVHGVRGLHGLVWEWVQDFNAPLIVGDSRGGGTPESRFFCGAGSLLATDTANYAAYMRYAFRTSLKGDYCVASLGFRAARQVGSQPEHPAVFKASTTAYDLPGQWLTQGGKSVPLATLRGKVRVVTMGFTRCRFACPRILGDMQRIEQALGADADKTGFVFLSIDPAHDTPAQMSRTLTEHRMNPERWTFLAAPEATVQETAVMLDFKYQLVEGLFAHSNLIAVLDEDGRVVHREEALDASIQPTVEAVRRLLAKR